jgi:hypothetical protein
MNLNQTDSADRIPEADLFEQRVPLESTELDDDTVPAGPGPTTTADPADWWEQQLAAVPADGDDEYPNAHDVVERD